MKESRKTYEPPRMKVFRFENNDQILTASGETSGGGGVAPTPDPTAEYAANALNQLFNGTNTTIE